LINNPYKDTKKMITESKEINEPIVAIWFQPTKAFG
jgi:hypothetical protein